MEKTVEVTIKFEWMDCCRNEEGFSRYILLKNVLESPFEFLHGRGKPMIKMIGVCASLPALFSQKYHF